jgi:preprotein translocase subunit SecA
MMTLLRLPEDVPIEQRMVSKAIQSAQTQMEQQNFEIRKNVLKYDEVLNKQRTVIYGERRKVLDGADLSDQIRDMVAEVVRGYIEGATASGYAEEWDLDQLWSALKTLYPISLSADEAIDQAGGHKSDLTREFLIEELTADAQAAYDAREEDLGSEVMREFERRVLLSVLDRKWREHLYEMDYLQEGIGLRAMAQRDPLVEYQREGFDMFGAMMDGIKEESVGFLFNLEVQVEEPTVPDDAAPGDGSLPQLDESLLAAAEQLVSDDAVPPPADRVQTDGHVTPHVSAKGLDRDTSAKPLVYSAPTLGSETPEVRVTGSDGSAAGGAGGASKSAKRQQQSRANPNRGSRGNRSSNARRRKR